MTKPKPGSTRGNPFARFDSFTNFEGPTPTGLDTPCWLWMGAPSHGGYAQFMTCVDGQRTAYAVHRFSYQRHVGPIPEGMTIDHLCRNTLCVNPDHLEAVTMRENTLRGTSPVAANKRKTHCIRGHEFTAANTRIDTRGNRNCRTCARERARLSRART